MNEIVTRKELQERQFRIIHQIKKTNNLINMQLIIGVLAFLFVIVYFILILTLADINDNLRHVYIAEFFFFSVIILLDLIRYDFPFLREINVNYRKVEIVKESEEKAENENDYLIQGISHYISSLYYFLCYLVKKRKKKISKNIDNEAIQSVMKTKLILNFVLGIFIPLVLAIFLFYIDFSIWYYVILIIIALCWGIIGFIWIKISRSLRLWFNVYKEFEKWGKELEEQHLSTEM